MQNVLALPKPQTTPLLTYRPDAGKSNVSPQKEFEASLPADTLEINQGSTDSGFLSPTMRKAVRKFGQVTWAGLAGVGGFMLAGKLLAAGTALGTAAAAAPLLGAGIAAVGVYAAWKSESTTTKILAGGAAAAAASVLATTLGAAPQVAELALIPEVAGVVAGASSLIGLVGFTAKAAVAGWNLPDNVAKFGSECGKKGFVTALADRIDPPRSEAQ